MEKGEESRANPDGHCVPPSLCPNLELSSRSHLRVCLHHPPLVTAPGPVAKEAKEGKKREDLGKVSMLPTFTGCRE